MDNKPSIQLGPGDVYSTDYEQEYSDLMLFGNYLLLDHEYEQTYY